MTEGQNIETYFQQAFTPTEFGLVGLVDQIVAASVGRHFRFQRVDDRVVCRQFFDGEFQEALTPIPAKNFRSILARIAVLLEDQNPKLFDPYGGSEMIVVGSTVTTMVEASFSNTPDKQFLELQGIPSD